MSSPEDKTGQTHRWCNRRFTATVAALLCAASCTPAPQRDQKPDGLIRLSDDDIKSTDPQAASDLATMRIAADQFEGLTRLDASGHAEPGLASGWQISADGLRWTFQLKPGLRFSDGHLIDAATFAQSYARLTDPAKASPLAELAAPIRAVTARTPAHVVVDLIQPVPHLPELVAHPAFAALPLHRVNWPTERPMITSGPYRLMQWQLGDRIALSANPAWHGGTPRTAHITWKPVTDSLTAMRMVMAGEADIAPEFPSSRLPSLVRHHPGLVRIASYRGTYYFAFNTRRAPFHDVRIRRALSLAVDRQWLAKRLMATGVAPSARIVPPMLAGDCPDEQFAPSPPDLREARRLLQDAGYGPARPLRFEIRFNSDADHRRTAVALAAMWKPLGVEAHLLNTEAALHFASMRRGDFTLARSGWIGDVSAPENFLSVHRASAGIMNYSGYNNPAYDAALDAALQEASGMRRVCAMARAERILLDDAPILPLWTYVSKTLVGPRVLGWQDNPANAHPSRTLGVK